MEADSTTTSAAAGESTLPLRVGALFAIMAVSGLGCLAPYLFIQERRRRESSVASPPRKRSSIGGSVALGASLGGSSHHHHGDDTKRHVKALQRARAVHLLKAFSAGIVLSVGFMHVLPDAHERFAAVTDYPAAFCVAMAGCLLVLVLSQVVEGIVTARRRQRRQTAAVEAAVAGAGAGEETSATAVKAAAAPGAATGVGASGAGGDMEAAAAAVPVANGGEERLKRLRSSFEVQHQHVEGQHHERHGGHHDAEHIVASFKRDSIVVAYLMEIGVVFHSILIGVSIGVMGSSPAALRPLVIAICLHQFFEGAGLATCILEAGLERSKNVGMYLLFSLTCPAGVGIGIAVSGVYDEGSVAAAAVEGTFNALAAGVLIYLALVEMLKEEMDQAVVKRDRVLQAQMFACILAGCTVMATLAVWA